MILEGFGIFVKDMSAMVRFYRDVLGFEIKEGETAGNVYLWKDGTLFLMYPRKDFEKLAGRPFNYAADINGHYEIAMKVDSRKAVDETFEKVVAAGAESVMKPTLTAWGQYTCYIADPEGNLIEITA